MITEQQRKYTHLSDLHIELLNVIDSLIFNKVLFDDECEDFKELVRLRIEDIRERLVKEETLDL